MELSEIFCSLLVYWVSFHCTVGGQVWMRNINHPGHRTSHQTAYWGSKRLGSGDYTNFPQGGALYKRDLGIDTFTESERTILAQKDHTFAVLDYMERTERQNNCSKGATLNHFNLTLPDGSYERFNVQADAVVRTANVLNNLFRTWDAQLYNDAFYYSLIRALVDSDSVLFGSAIAFDSNQYDRENFERGHSAEKGFIPYVYKNKFGRVVVKDLAPISKGRYARYGTEGYDWFWKHRQKNFSALLWHHQDICKRSRGEMSASRIINSSGVVSSRKEGLWTAPYYDCHGAQAWLVTYSVPFFGCNRDDKIQFKGVVAITIDVHEFDINQCSVDGGVFTNTHRCRRSTTSCSHVAGEGFRLGSYHCQCLPGYYFPYTSTTNQFNGSRVEEEYRKNLLNKSNLYHHNFTCLPCKKGCTKCDDASPCLAEYNVMLRGIPLGIQSFCMTISLVVGFIILRLRKSKVMKASMWIMLEILLAGALLLYSTVVIQYFEPSTATCLLMPWFREVGFAVVYGALILKIYRVLAEFQSRKAHRVHVRDKDLLKYLAGIVLIVIGYMSAWTAVNMDHVREGDSMLDAGTTSDGLQFSICKSFWWDYVIEIGEFLFLCLGIYLCHCVRAAPTDYGETRFITVSIYLETVVSGVLHICRHIIWLTLHPDYIFLMYFVRCQLTVSVALLLVLGPKLWYAHRPPEDEHFRNRAYSTSDVHDTILPESMKLQVGISSNGDVDVGEINLSEMDPEDIRAELKRLYTQLQIYKTKTMRKDNPHISKRRGGRKQTHRRFSLQAFHYKHRHHHSSSTGGDHDHEHELSKTPEESTNSAEGVAIQMEGSSRGEESDARTPTVSFKPGHKSFS